MVSCGTIELCCVRLKAADEIVHEITKDGTKVTLDFIVLTESVLNLVVTCALNGVFWRRILKHAKRQVKWYKRNIFPTLRFIVMFITAVSVWFLFKLRSPKKKSIVQYMVLRFMHFTALNQFLNLYAIIETCAALYIKVAFRRALACVVFQITPWFSLIFYSPLYSPAYLNN